MYECGWSLTVFQHLTSSLCYVFQSSERILSCGFYSKVKQEKNVHSLPSLQERSNEVVTFGSLFSGYHLKVNFGGVIGASTIITLIVTK